MIWFGWVLWHINHCRLFNAKSSFIHIYQIYMICLVGFMAYQPYLPTPPLGQDITQGQF